MDRVLAFWLAPPAFCSAGRRPPALVHPNRVRPCIWYQSNFPTTIQQLQFTFSDPLNLDSFKLDAETESRLFNGFNSSKPCPLSAKKKRRSLAEKFLEDNSEYYGIQVREKEIRLRGFGF
jgi:hypothetical protein